MAVKEIVPFAQGRLQDVFATLERELTGRDHLLDTFSAADIMTGYILMWFPELLEQHPSLQAYCERLRQRPAWQRAAQ